MHWRRVVLEQMDRPTELEERMRLGNHGYPMGAHGEPNHHRRSAARPPIAMTTSVQGPVRVPSVVVAVPAVVSLNVVRVAEVIIQPLRSMYEYLIRWNMDVAQF